MAIWGICLSWLSGLVIVSTVVLSISIVYSVHTEVFNIDHVVVVGLSTVCCLFHLTDFILIW